MNIPLGFVILVNGVPHTGHAYTAGAKVYKSEKMARAAIKGHNYLASEVVEFVPAFAEVIRGYCSCGGPMCPTPDRVIGSKCIICGWIVNKDSPPYFST